LVVLVCLVGFDVCTLWTEKQAKPDNPFQPLGKKYTVMAVTMMLASAIGNMTFQPNRIN
jgi:hypothetical protein